MFNLRVDQYLLLGSSAFCAGLFGARFYGSVTSVYLFSFVFILLFVVLRLWLLVSISVLVFGLVLGSWRTSEWHDSWRWSQVSQGQVVSLTGRVNNDAVYDDRRQVQFEIDGLQLDDGRHIKGKLRVAGYGINAVYRYDQVRVSGKLRRGFGTRVAAISFANVEVIGTSSSAVEDVRRGFSAALFSSLTNEQASLALGILVGQRTNIPDDLQDSLRVVGLTHIIAVSGYNLSVLVRLVRRGLSKASLFQSTLLSIVLVAIFVTLAGNSASVIRAAWVIGLSLASHVCGRNIKPLNLLIISAACTAWFDPLYVWYDLGWWLSFGAFYGVLLIAPALTAKIYKDKDPGLVPQMVIETFAASLLTTPIIMWSFGRVSLITILANVLVGPATPLLMISSFVVGLAFIFGLPRFIYGVTVYVAQNVLGYVIKLAEYLSAVPYAEVPLTLSTAQMITVYLAIILASYFLNMKQPCKEGYNLIK